MTAINTNVGALNARLYALGANRDQERAMERLSSGMRVNSAADDAAGLAVAGKMESQLRGINMAIRNNQDGVGLIQTAESGLNEIRNMVLRIRELAVQMANGIYENTPDRANAQLEVTALLTIWISLQTTPNSTMSRCLMALSQALQFKQVNNS